MAWSGAPGDAPDGRGDARRGCVRPPRARHRLPALRTGRLSRAARSFVHAANSHVAHRLQLRMWVAVRVSPGMPSNSPDNDDIVSRRVRLNPALGRPPDPRIPKLMEKGGVSRATVFAA